MPNHIKNTSEPVVTFVKTLFTNSCDPSETKSEQT